MLHLLVASHRVLASPYSARLAIPDELNEAESVHAIALRLTPLHQSASTAGLLQTPPHLLHGERALTMVHTFQLTRSARLRLAHGGSRDNRDLVRIACTSYGHSRRFSVYKSAGDNSRRYRRCDRSPQRQRTSTNKFSLKIRSAFIFSLRNVTAVPYTAADSWICRSLLWSQILQSVRRRISERIRGRQLEWVLERKSSEHQLNAKVRPRVFRRWVSRHALPSGSGPFSERFGRASRRVRHRIGIWREHPSGPSPVELGPVQRRRRQLCLSRR